MMDLLDFSEMERRPMYYRRDGTPYTGPRMRQALAWAEDHKVAANRVVRQTPTLYGEVVSTVWLGLDHGFLLGRPLIFETMIMTRTSFRGYQRRYSTEEEALAGHERTVYLCLLPPFLRDRAVQYLDELHAVFA